ncbi:nuclear transport factor 2 family protein [Photobacterium sanguinicancri]|uniref:nuclear transport factor 2 family protein n=1 Tax=Photobacterium sanguinicancri TaxID=875932 RepID=UPI0026E45E10|nr:nuclear transport factor 2 family protein [Photobacterium sanguinicancri]MDO6498658.1 nuclear transport factor 2 family protein [Photobacterium sanguinicancri]
MTSVNLDACKAAISRWKLAFNQQNAADCAEQYSQDAVMDARPFGRFEGREAIQAFWENIMEQGFNDVDYTDVTWEKVDEKNYILTAKWTMNKAFGAVHHELWQVQKDGVARLITDDFEVLGER